MSAHTPGPWVKSGPYQMVGGGRCLSIDGGGITVATVGANDEDLAPAHADASLIAAAPELLVLVEELAAGPDLRACDTRGERNDARNQWLLMLREKARAAIAKAEGKP